MKIVSPFKASGVMPFPDKRTSQEEFGDEYTKTCGDHPGRKRTMGKI